MTDSTTPNPHFDRVSRLVAARDLEGVESATHEGSPALTVAGRPFVHLAEPGIVVLHCPVDQKVLLMEISPDLFFETDAFIGQDAVLVHLAQISDEELSLKLEDAWTFKAPAFLKSLKR